MRDFEDIDGDCNESQPRWDESDDWEPDDFRLDDVGEEGSESDSEGLDDLPF
jgi:hypothetical protein